MKRKLEFTPEFARQLLGYDHDPTEDKITLSKERTIATLWAGYGTVSRITISSSNHGKRTLVIKRVLPPNENDNSIGNQRKLKSYRVEAAFYREMAPYIIHKMKGGQDHTAMGTSTAAVVSCPIAQPYLIEISDDEDGGRDESYFHFILSDLSERYNQRYRSDVGQVKAAIKWLAAFHSIFYLHSTATKSQTNNNDTTTMSPSLNNVWPEGGYWHLKTRLEELDQISTSHGIFQSSAFAIDKRMNDGPWWTFTLVHGDFKEENVLFGKDDDGNWICSAVDFQYCGRGYGAKDLVMFLVSSVSAKVFDEITEDGFLGMYAEELKKNLMSMGHCLSTHRQEIDKIVDCKVLKMQYELALVDYVRFMAGWGFWGYNSRYADRRATEVLTQIYKNWSGKGTKSSIHGLSRKDWKEAVYEYYPL